MKDFKQYISESYDIELGQAMANHEVPVNNGINIDNPKIQSEINQNLAIILNRNNRSSGGGSILTPEAGFERIRKVLDKFAIHLPPVLDLDPDEGEEVFQVNQFGTPFGPLPSGSYGDVRDNLYLYVYYYQQEHGYYEFFAQVVDEKELSELMGEDEED